ncbi:hypothetical protein PRIPAC_76121 [Pristionchus pacificus]|uniref:Uncharacterized protein n=1 Tax=Pristionchus pacificus TaxID=54126 RepID=A0A2A6C6A5_PRIPA|nr:hypothetical protein PRIPAC_76121 [Pristionchus pacificus]|eukprot:PDM73646.1 hypothetical protein PRIPAC_41002 [Pristionchus pacificus]
MEYGQVAYHPPPQGAGGGGAHPPPQGGGGGLESGQMCNSRSASASAAGAAEEEGVGDDGESEADGESAEHGWKDCVCTTLLPYSLEYCRGAAAEGGKLS